MNGKQAGEKSFSRGVLYALLKNPLYIGKIRHKGERYDGQHAAIVDPVIWHRAQALLTDNQHKNKTRTLAKDPSLLAGLLFDDNNYPMSPTHTRKHQRRYRYYISQAALQFKEKDTGSVVRISAYVIESLVINTLMALLTTAQTLLDAIQSPSHTARDIRRYITNAATLATTWQEKLPSEHIAMLKTAIHRITLGNRAVTMVFSPSGLRRIIQPDYDFKFTDKDEAPEADYTIVKSVYLKRCGIETKLIIPENTPATAHPETVQAIQKAVAKALTWNEALLNGQVASMTALAKQEQVVPQFIVRRMKLAFLAPDIMEAIFHGHIPHTLTIGKLEKSIPLS